MTITNDDIKKLRSRFLEETKTLRNQIDNKKAKIEQEQKTLRNHQKRYDEKIKEYENEVNNLITHLVLRNGIDNNQAKTIYNYLMEGNSNGKESEN